eukprot:TRINITY_DN17405_c0_g1_i3.p1 TRINITY_DN17405_c0_g1~~TRINITY_DN17405_c0_g1_i3.p1  ORF type:complete len:149 (+),score=40.87 TRINITY_DN17405_c0_g1_i3:82-528(+)
MIRRPPRSTQGVSSAASDVYKRQVSTQSTWEERQVSTEEGKKMASQYNMKFYETSAKQDVNIVECVEDMVRDVYDSCGMTEDIVRVTVGKSRSKTKKGCCSQLHFILSVSYTHLRAHETSLHLVCRLLLEKKKKKNVYPHNEIYIYSR